MKKYSINDDKLVIANREFNSRLFLGTGKFSSNDVLTQTIVNSETELVTVAIRRCSDDLISNNILDAIDENKILILPNTSGAKDAEDAVKLALIAEQLGFKKWIKLEITPDPFNLLPDGTETLIAAEMLIKKGWNVLPYINADPILAKKLEEIGTVTVMPLASPIGTNKGIKTEEMLNIIIEQSNVPVVIDAGIGNPSDATRCMELGADAVLVNTAIASSNDSINMGYAFNQAIKSGRIAFKVGLNIISKHAIPSSPAYDFINELK